MQSASNQARGRLLLPGFLIMLQCLAGCAASQVTSSGDLQTNVDIIPEDLAVVIDSDTGEITLRCEVPEELPPAPVLPVLSTEGSFKSYLAARIVHPPIPDTPDQLLKFQEEKRADLLISFGFDQIEPPGTPVPVISAGETEVDGVTFERLLLEVHPGTWIPVLVGYREDLKTQGLLPGILVHHGHDQPGKTRTEVLTLGMTLALRGALVVMPDWFGFGDLSGEPYKHVNTQGNLLAGVPMNLPISSSGRRVLDYLVAREDVDPQRIGAVGHSGGAETVFYLSAMDPRIKATAVVDGVDDWDNKLEKGLFRDPEHFPTGLLTFADYRVVLALSAPRALFVLSGDSDLVAAPTEVIAKVVGYAREAYAVLGAEAALKHSGFPGGHNLGKPKREAVYEFFAEALAIPELDKPEEKTWSESSKLHIEVPGDNVTLREVVWDLLQELIAALKGSSREALIAVLGFPSSSAPKAALPEDWRSREQTSLLVERADGPPLPVELYSPRGWSGRRAILCLSDLGRSDCHGIAGILAGTGWTVLAADLRSFGELEDDWPVNDPWDRIRLANFAIALGDPLINQCTRDIADLAVFAVEELSLAGVGVLALGERSGFISQVAAAALEDLSPLAFAGSAANLVETFSRDPAYPVPADIFPYGMLTATDEEGLKTLISPRKYLFLENRYPGREEADTICRFFLSTWKSLD